MADEVDALQRKVCIEGRIWDLHIHTQSDKLKNVSPKEYAVKLGELFAEECYKNLDLVSFTDHNCINVEAYESFWNARSHVSLIPGIEVDTYLDEAAKDAEEHADADDGDEPEKSKHLIVYFDAVDDLETTKKLASELNEWLSVHAVGPDNPIYIATLLTKLINVCHVAQTRFVLSPHTMKQNGKRNPRGIDSVWNHLEAAEQKYEASKYIDQFFCFWEAGQSNIAKAIEFLKEIVSGSRVSIISFSDSKCLDDEKRFLDKPRQYFRALPSFNGLVMVGSEPSRILDSPKEIPSQNQGSYLGSIDFDGSTIELSPQMNAIIGGRGTGKSVMLDSIAHCLGKASQLKKERIDFLGKHSAMVKSMDGLSLNGSSFNCDFFKQNYILSLFEKDGEEFNEALEDYFSDAFSQVDDYEIDDQRSPLRESFTSNYQYEGDAAIISENIAGLIEKYTEDQNDGLNIKIKKSLVGTVTKELKTLSYDDVISNIRKAVMSKLPKFLKENEAILKDLTALEKTVAREAFSKRQEYLGGTYLKTKIYEEVAAKKKEISTAQKDKQNVAEAFSQQLDKRYAPYEKRIALINAYLKASEEFVAPEEHFIEKSGEHPGAFQFVKTLIVEHPIDYLVRILDSAIQVIDRGKPCHYGNLWKYIKAFCYGSAQYKSGKSAETVVKDLEAFDLHIEPKDVIRYRESEDKPYEDISTMSPGTQTNILFEYIVHKDTSIPLLIDQPEDNVDNQTIYSELRRWFKELKSKRQVIVVTHDANIVINADAENVIIAKHPELDKFSYMYGALEYEGIIDSASNILDGGPEAVKRRLVKYGSR
mgnify:CR=1 FL=1